MLSRGVWIGALVGVLSWCILGIRTIGEPIYHLLGQRSEIVFFLLPAGWINLLAHWVFEMLPGFWGYVLSIGLSTAAGGAAGAIIERLFFRKQES